MASIRMISPRWFALAAIGLLPPPATAQFGGAGVPDGLDLAGKLDGVEAHRVYQRGADGTGSIPIAWAGEGEPPEIRISAVLRSEETARQVARSSISPKENDRIESVRFEDGVLSGVPAGGPYWLVVAFENRVTADVVGPVFVGDLWVLAGQSNMQGVGDLEGVTPPHPKVMLFGMDRAWRPAEEPLHWLVDSPDPVHSGDPATREERSAEEHANRAKGAGLGLPFASKMVEETGVPIGLVAVAHGGTSMAQWDPAKEGEGGESLYGSMMTSIEAVGGEVAGVLWYQGESDANPEAADAYAETFADFIAAVRDDFGQPALPFYYVQIGRFVVDRDAEAWKVVQEAQRLLPDRVPYAAVVASIDLELDDLIHVGTQGLKRLGERLANVALHELHGRPGGSTPTLDAVIRGPEDSLIVRFKGVDFDDGVGLRPARHVPGFSIRDEDGDELPLIYDARVAPSGDAVILDLTGEAPDGAQLWYGAGLDPYCALVDGLDMAPPAFGPIALDDLP